MITFSQADPSAGQVSARAHSYGQVSNTDAADRCQMLLHVATVVGPRSHPDQSSVMLGAEKRLANDHPEGAFPEVGQIALPWGSTGVETRLCTPLISL